MSKECKCEETKFEGIVSTENCPIHNCSCHTNTGEKERWWRKELRKQFEGSNPKHETVRAIYTASIPAYGGTSVTLELLAFIEMVESHTIEAVKEDIRKAKLPNDKNLHVIDEINKHLDLILDFAPSLNTLQKKSNFVE